jgi:hypothetical protein
MGFTGTQPTLCFKDIVQYKQEQYTLQTQVISKLWNAAAALQQCCCSAAAVPAVL